MAILAPEMTYTPKKLTDQSFSLDEVKNGRYLYLILMGGYAERYCEGVLPVCALKNRTKCWGYSKPNIWLTWLMLSELLLSISLAALIMWVAMMSLAVRPVSTLTNSPK